MKQRCTISSKQHDAESCSIDPPDFPKCANCDGKHRSNDANCPSLLRYRQLRLKASISDQNHSQHHQIARARKNQQPVPPKADFPPLRRTNLFVPATLSRTATAVALASLATPAPSVSSYTIAAASLVSSYAAAAAFNPATTHTTSAATAHNTHPTTSVPLTSANTTTHTDANACDQNNDLSIEEWVEVLRVMIQRFSHCRSRQEKFAVIAVLAIRYDC